MNACMYIHGILYLVNTAKSRIAVVVNSDVGSTPNQIADPSTIEGKRLTRRLCLKCFIHKKHALLYPYTYILLFDKGGMIIFIISYR